MVINVVDRFGPLGVGINTTKTNDMTVIKLVFF